MQVANPIFYLHRNRPRSLAEIRSKKGARAPLASGRFFGLDTLISSNVFSWWGWVPRFILRYPRSFVGTDGDLYCLNHDVLHLYLLPVKSPFWLLSPPLKITRRAVKFGWTQPAEDPDPREYQSPNRKTTCVAWVERITPPWQSKSQSPGTKWRLIAGKMIKLNRWFSSKPCWNYHRETSQSYATW